MKLEILFAAIIATSACMRPAFAQLNPLWQGTWKSQDGKKTLIISASKINSSEEMPTDKGKPRRFQYEYQWVSKSEPEDGGFGYLNTRVSPAEISKRYIEAVQAYKKDPTDFSISETKASREAIAAISPGVYKVMWSYAGGDCAYWEYILDKDNILEINKCKYRFGVQLFSRVQ